MPSPVDPPRGRPAAARPIDARPVAARVESATGYPPLFWAAVAGCSLLGMALLAGRMRATGQAAHTSLVWDVFLAWVPIGPAVLIHRLSRRPVLPRVRVALLGVVWLLFFPNAPYLLTQPIHLHREYGPSRRPLPAWLHDVSPIATAPRPPPGWYEYLLLTTVAVAGLLLTLASLLLIERAVARRLGRPAAASASVCLLALAGLGVAVGRFTRLNSWDVFRRPVVAARRIGDWADETRFVVSALVLSALLVFVYVAFKQAARADRHDDRDTSPG